MFSLLNLCLTLIANVIHLGNKDYYYYYYLLLLCFIALMSCSNSPNRQSYEMLFSAACPSDDNIAQSGVISTMLHASSNARTFEFPIGGSYTISFIACQIFLLRYSHFQH